MTHTTLALLSMAMRPCSRSTEIKSKATRAGATHTTRTLVKSTQMRRASPLSRRACRYPSVWMRKKATLATTRRTKRRKRAGGASFKRNFKRNVPIYHATGEATGEAGAAGAGVAGVAVVRVSRLQWVYHPPVLPVPPVLPQRATFAPFTHWLSTPRQPVNGSNAPWNRFSRV